MAGAEPGLCITAGMRDEKTRVITLGCRLNAYESEVIAGLAAAAGVGPAVVVKDRKSVV